MVSTVETHLQLPYINPKPLSYPIVAILYLQPRITVTETNLPPTPPKYAKVFTVTNFKNLMLLKLDVDKLNYSDWSDLFTIQIRGCQTLEFIQPPASNSTCTVGLPLPTDEWITTDSIIQSWIFSTISDQLVKRVLKAKPKPARDIWEFIEKIFKDNKRLKIVELVGELHTLDIGDLSVDAYFRKIDSLATRLDNLGSNVTEKDLVTYAIHVLSDKYDPIAHVILNQNPFPDLDTVRSMISLVGARMNRNQHSVSSSRILSSPTALVSQTSMSRTQGHQRLLGQHGQSAQIRNSHGSNRLGGTRGFTSFLGQQIRGLVDNQQTRGNSFDTQETNLPHAFNTLTLQDFGDFGDVSWNMDTGANGRSQQISVDCDETFSPTVKSATIHTFLSLPASQHWPVHQVDVKNAFLHGQLSKIRIISSLHQEFSMTDLGTLNYFLGIFVSRDDTSMFLHQRQYALEVLEKDGMLNCHPCRTAIDIERKIGAVVVPVSHPILYRSLVGAFRYLTFTHLDLSYSAQQICLYMHDPREPYLTALKRILHYVCRTIHYWLQLFSSLSGSLVFYTDADWLVAYHTSDYF
ncbi:ribonuclease H-like domain-containing protein [Tanacetum coccineum]